MLVSVCTYTGVRWSFESGMCMCRCGVNLYVWPFSFLFVFFIQVLMIFVVIFLYSVWNCLHLRCKVMCDDLVIYLFFKDVFICLYLFVCVCVCDCVLICVVYCRDMWNEEAGFAVAHAWTPPRPLCLWALLAQPCLSIFVTGLKFNVSYFQLTASEPCMNELVIYTKCLIKSAAALE